jgi:cell wall-associated NlpC family hydrolase
MASLRARLVLVVGLGTVCVLLMSAGRAVADPSLASRRAQAEALMETIRALDEDVGAAAERLNGARLELRRVRLRADEAGAELERSEALYSQARSRVAARLRQLYVEGGFGSAEEVILGARSLAEVLDRIELAQRVARHDSMLVREAVSRREEAAAQLAEVSVVRERQALVVRELAHERQSILKALTARAALLSSLQGEIARLEAEEQARQAALRRGVDETVGALPASAGSRVAAIAMRYLGVPYKWGSATPERGLDCSGLVLRVYAELGVELPHYAAAQYELGARVDRLALEPGDLVFFRDLEHVGIYIGDDYFIHAPRTGDVVKIALLSDPYYVRQWVGARRLL